MAGTDDKFDELQKERVDEINAQCSASGSNELLCDLQKDIRGSFMTCNSNPNGSYYVRLTTDSLASAHKLHRLLVEFSNI